MELRSLIPMAPLLLRPMLSLLVAWTERTDARLAALENLARNTPKAPPC